MKRILHSFFCKKAKIWVRRAKLNGRKKGSMATLEFRHNTLHREKSASRFLLQK